MSDARAALERAQARVLELERAEPSPRQLDLLAGQLEREAAAWELAITRGERRVLKNEIGLASRLLGFGFTLLFVTPIVAMVGVSLARLIRHEFELSLASLICGLMVVLLVSWPKSSRAIAHRFSGAWRLARSARARAARLRAFGA